MPKDYVEERGGGYFLVETLVSHDRRTMPGHFREFVANRTSPGVLLVSQDVEIGTAIDELILIWATTEVSEWVNRIGYLPL